MSDYMDCLKKGWYWYLDGCHPEPPAEDIAHTLNEYECIRYDYYWWGIGGTSDRHCRAHPPEDCSAIFLGAGLATKRSSCDKAGCQWDIATNTCNNPTFPQMNKQEFIDKILEVGGGRPIDIAILPRNPITPPFPEIYNQWHLSSTGKTLIYETTKYQEGATDYRIIKIYDIDSTNPPTFIERIYFYNYGDVGESAEIPYDWAIARINELPFLSDEEPPPPPPPPPCTDGTHETLEYCLDGITEKSWRDCINNEWVYNSQECPGEPPGEPVCNEGTHETLEYCPDGITEKNWRDCIEGNWVYNSQTCPDEEAAKPPYLLYAILSAAALGLLIGVIKR